MKHIRYHIANITMLLVVGVLLNIAFPTFWQTVLAAAAYVSLLTWYDFEHERKVGGQ